MPFRGTSVVHPLYPCVDEPIPMRQPPTGEPCAGEPHARFGGRGRESRSRPLSQSEGLCLMIEVPPALFSQEPDYRQGGTMSNEIDVIAGVGLDQRARKSHWPARLDWAQSASGLFLGLFMWGHMAF